MFIELLLNIYVIIGYSITLSLLDKDDPDLQGLLILESLAISLSIINIIYEHHPVLSIIELVFISITIALIMKLDSDDDDKIHNTSINIIISIMIINIVRTFLSLILE